MVPENVKTYFKENNMLSWFIYIVLIILGKIYFNLNVELALLSCILFEVCQTKEK